MPNRYIKESCVGSNTLTALSDAAERFFWRLTTVADDYGRFDANPAMLLGRCVPTLEWTKRKVVQCFSELCRIVDGDECPLVELYQVKGRLYGRFTNWSNHQRDRTKDKEPPKPKFPSPDEGTVYPPQRAAACGDLQQLAALNESESEDGNENESVYRPTPRLAAPAPPRHILDITPRGKRAIRDDDAPTDKHRSFALSLGIDVGPEWGKFKNYCLAHDKRYANFEAAFRNWLANAQNMNGGKRVLQ